MKKLMLTIASAAALSGAAVQADEQRVSINVAEMTCPSCNFIVGRSIHSVESTSILDFTEGFEFGEGVFVVTYDDAVATPDMIVEAVMANGYPAEVLTDDNS